MGDIKERFEKFQRDAKEKFQKIDDRLNLSEKVEEGVKAAAETTKKSVETIKGGVEKLKDEAEKTNIGKRAFEVAEDTYETVEETAKKAWDASESVREAAEDVKENAEEVFGTATGGVDDVLKNVRQKAGKAINVASEEAGKILGKTKKTFESTAKGVSKSVRLGFGWTRTIDLALKTFQKTTERIQERPLQAFSTGASMIIGAGFGFLFTGVNSHWLLNSALPSWSVQKASKLFTDYLKDQESLVKKGNLSEAEAERIKFERKIAKYVGAPLLGAFSFASGAVMLTNVLNPKKITGYPIDRLLGRNPVLERLWFFGNGMVCFKTSYDFFMFSFENHEDLQEVVKEIKGMPSQDGKIQS